MHTSKFPTSFQNPRSLNLKIRQLQESLRFQLA